MEDVLLVKRAIKGDRQSFEKLMDIYFDRLCREAYIRCKYEEDVKEIVQETIYKAYRNIRSLKEPQYFKTWLSRILINVANDYLRNKGMVDLELDETSYVKEVVIEDKIEIKIDLYNAIDELEDKYKDAVILRYIDDLKIEDISKILENLNEDEVKITLTRDENCIDENIKLKKYGKDKRLGLWVRDKISGVGTITFYDPQEAVFKGIGHAIIDSDTNELLKIKQGYIYKPKKLNIEKGTNEKTGYLYGDFDLKSPIGEFKCNSNFGITGIYNSEKKKSTQLMEVGSEKDINLGKAYILLEDKNIIDISTDEQSTRQISIEVTDDRLINYTGGIIQGMSGAPIIQDNKLIGAVTHVIKDNPKKGYGIFIEEMIKLENKD